MAKWVTFHWNVFTGISNYQEHNTKEDATVYFKQHYRSFFQIAPKFDVKLPCSYGYGHRKFFGMSLLKFKRTFGKR